MPPGRFTRRRRTASQALADERTAELAAAMGRALKEARLAGGFRQAQAAAAAGIAQSTWSAMERGRGASLSWRVWMRATHALGSDLHTYLERTSAASRPRDAVHLRHQELVAGMAASGGWTVRPEAESGSGFADLLLERTSATGVGEVCLVEVWDWLPDVGDAFRSWQRKLAHLEARVRAGANEDRAARLGGAWVLRATSRNRALVRDHPALFRAQFPGDPGAWLTALVDSARPLPPAPVLVWVSVSGDRLWAARL